MSAKLEKRIAALEQQVAALRQGQISNAPTGREWVDDLYGKFAGDPIFEKAMKLGRQYRRSLRPSGRNGKSKR